MQPGLKSISTYPVAAMGSISENGIVHGLQSRKSVAESVIRIIHIAN